MPRRRNIPRTVIDYNKLSDGMKELYDKISDEFNQKNIFGLREQAAAMQVESPTTLSKSALIRRMTDKVICEYMPDGGKSALMDVAEKELALHKSGMFYYASNGDGKVKDVVVPPAIIRQNDLREGDLVEGLVAETGKNRAIIFVEKINGEPVNKKRRLFDKIEVKEGRSFDLRGTFAKVVFDHLRMGERVIVSKLNMNHAKSIADSFDESILLLVGMPVQMNMPEGFIAPFDMPQEETISTARCALGRAKRLVESGNDVVLVVYGADAIGDRDVKKAIFGAGRCFERGSLTVITDLDKDQENGLFAKVATRII